MKQLRIKRSQLSNYQLQAAIDALARLALGGRPPLAPLRRAAATVRLACLERRLF
jgi:hypothetical protein